MKWDAYHFMTNDRTITHQAVEEDGFETPWVFFRCHVIVNVVKFIFNAVGGGCASGLSCTLLSFIFRLDTKLCRYIVVCLVRLSTLNRCRSVPSLTEKKFWDTPLDTTSRSRI